MATRFRLLTNGLLDEGLVRLDPGDMLLPDTLESCGSITNEGNARTFGSLAYGIPGTRRYGPFRSFASFESNAVFEFGQLLLRATEGAYGSLVSRLSCKSDVNNACKPHVQSKSENCRAFYTRLVW